MAKIDIEIGGKYSAGQAFAQAQDQAKQLGSKYRDAGEMGKKSLEGVKNVVSSQTVPAVQGLFSILDGFLQGGIFGLIGGAAVAAFAMVKSSAETAKEEVQKLTEAIKGAYTAASQKIDSSLSETQKQTSSNLKNINNNASFEKGSESVALEKELIKLKQDAVNQLKADNSESNKIRVEENLKYQTESAKLNSAVNQAAIEQEKATAIVAEMQTAETNALNAYNKSQEALTLFEQNNQNFVQQQSKYNDDTIGIQTRITQAYQSQFEGISQSTLDEMTARKSSLEKQLNYAKSAYEQDLILSGIKSEFNKQYGDNAYERLQAAQNLEEEIKLEAEETRENREKFLAKNQPLIDAYETLKNSVSSSKTAYDEAVANKKSADDNLILAEGKLANANSAAALFEEQHQQKVEETKKKTLEAESKTRETEERLAAIQQTRQDVLNDMTMSEEEKTHKLNELAKAEEKCLDVVNARNIAENSYTGATDSLAKNADEYSAKLKLESDRQNKLKEIEETREQVNKDLALTEERRKTILSNLAKAEEQIKETADQRQIVENEYLKKAQQNLNGKKTEKDYEAEFKNLKIQSEVKNSDDIGSAVDKGENFRDWQKKQRDEEKKKRSDRSEMLKDSASMVMFLKGEKNEKWNRQFSEYLMKKYTPDQIKELRDEAMKKQLLSKKEQEEQLQIFKRINGYMRDGVGAKN